jgi:serine/threonine-protein kinase HipA
MIKLDVWLTLPEGKSIPCGELAFNDPDNQGNYRSAFRYTPNYLAHPSAFPLDPEMLPLEAIEWETARLTPPLMIFEDALPDDWGRKLLVRRAGLKRGQQGEPNLLQALGNGGMGALAFLPPGTAWQPREDHHYELQDLHDAVRRYELGEHDDDDRYLTLLYAGSSPGGARPKALLRDEDGQWLAKFASVKDKVDMVGIEAATMELASRAGLEVAESKMVELSGSHKALLVRRFDITPAGGRIHMMSFQTALAASGWYVLGYSDLIDWIRQHGSQPAADVQSLYRWMVFNALVGNTDDHLKNFWLVGGKGGFCLAPSFDLLPNVNDNTEHVLNFDLKPTIKLEELPALGKKWGVTRAQAIVEEVRAVMPQYPTIAESFGVPDEQIEHLCRPSGGRNGR